MLHLLTGLVMLVDRCRCENILETPVLSTNYIISPVDFPSANPARKDADTCPALTFAILALFIAPWSAADDALMEILWTWSQTLEGFAMVPQYVCSYRNTVSGASMLVLSFEGCEPPTIEIM